MASGLRSLKMTALRRLPARRIMKFTAGVRVTKSLGYSSVMMVQSFTPSMTLIRVPTGMSRTMRWAITSGAMPRFSITARQVMALFTSMASVMGRVSVCCSPAKV